MPIPLAHTRRFLGGVAALLLAGCELVPAVTPAVDPGDHGSEPSTEQKVTTSAPAAIEEPVAAPPPSQSPPPADEASGGTQPRPDTNVAAAAAQPEPETRPEETRKPNPDDLLGMSEAETTSKLGLPQSRRDEPPAHVWRYAAESCMLDVFFFVDVNDNSRHVLSYDIQIEDGAPQDALACYRAIEERHAAALQNFDPR